MNEGKAGNTDIQELLNDPDRLPTDANELAELLASVGGGDSEFDPVTEPKPDGEGKSGADADPNAPADAKAAAGKGGGEPAAASGGESQPGETPAAGEKPEGVLAKDKKHIIPYAVLESTRARAEEADRIAKEAQQREQEARRLADEALARANRLEEEMRQRAAGEDPAPRQDAGKGGNTDDELIGKLEQSNAALERLAEDTPALAEIFAPIIEANRTYITRLGELKSRVDEFESRARDEDARESERAKSDVQEAIDANPVLRYWQAEDADAWNRAARFEMRMRGLNDKGERVSDPDPDYIALPLNERFDFVVQTMQARYGQVELPEKYRPAAPAGGSQGKPAGGAPASQDGDIKARAEAKLREAEGSRPMTLSDLPGGAPPQLGDRRLEEMSLQEVELKVNKMLDQGMSIQDIVSQYG